jgi:hypothetical protein
MDRITALPVDDNISSSVIYITDNTLGLDRPEGPIDILPNTQSVVLSLDQDTTEANLILEGITGCKPSSGLPAPSIQYTPIDKASGREHILSLAFPTLYPTGQADLNTPWLQEVPLKDYTYHLLCWHNQRFAWHTCWCFFIFNIYMCQKARSTAQFYVSQTTNIKDLTCEELSEVLDTDTSLLPQIICQGALLPGIQPY